MLDLDEYIVNFRKLKDKFIDLSKFFKIDIKSEELKKLEETISSPNFWDDNKKAEKVLKSQKRLLNLINIYNDLEEKIQMIEEYIEIIKEEMDEEIFAEIVKEYDYISSSIDSLKDIELLRK